MYELPSQVTDLLEQIERDLVAVFCITENGNAIFAEVNDAFIKLHVDLGMELGKKDLIGIDMEDYFRFHLGFTNEQVNSRMNWLKNVLESGESIAHSEVSDHPGVLAMVLDSRMHPVETESKTHVVWESRMILQSKHEND